MKIAIFNYLDFSFVTSKEAFSYSVVEDFLVSQNSTFEVLDSESIEKMMVVVAPLKNGHVYIGIIKSVVFNQAKKTSTITTEDLSTIMDYPVSLATFENLNFGDKIKAIFDSIFITTTDLLQKISWISCVNISTAIGSSPAWSANSAESLLSMISDIMDISSIGFRMSLNSTNTGVVMTIFDRQSSEATLKLTEEFVSNLQFSSTSQSATNKIVYLPQADNYINKTEKDYYLLNDGTVTTDANNNNRLSPVVAKILYYADSQMSDSTLESTAKSNLSESLYSHEISFRIRTVSIKIETIASMIKNIYPGMKITLYGLPQREGVPQPTIITKISYTDNDYIDVTCGYSRSSLTDRLKLAKKKEGQTVSVSYKIAPGSQAGFDSKTYTRSAPHTDIASLSTTISLPAGAILQSVSSSYPGSANETSDNWTIMDNQPRISETYDETTKVWTVKVTVGYNLSSTFTSDFRLNLSVRVSYAYITT